MRIYGDRNDLYNTPDRTLHVPPVVRELYLYLCFHAILSRPESESLRRRIISGRPVTGQALVNVTSTVISRSRLCTMEGYGSQVHAEVSLRFTAIELQFLSERSEMKKRFYTIPAGPFLSPDVFPQCVGTFGLLRKINILYLCQ